MKRWFPIVAAAFLIAGCDNSNDKPPAAPQASSGTSSARSATDDQLVTGPRGPAETLPQANAPGAAGDAGRDSAATKPKEDLSKQQEQQAMPKAGQANNHSSEALSAPGSNSGPAQGGPAPGGSTQAGSTQAGSTQQLAQSGAAQPAAQPVTQEQALALMKKHNCSSCHAVDKKLIGPSYKEVATKYKGDPAAEAKLIDKVVKGGSGVWGPVPMPPHPTVPKEDIKAIVDWILAGAS